MNTNVILTGYFKNFKNPQLTLLLELQKIVDEIVKEGVWQMKYGIPTKVVNGKNVCHIGAFKNHVALFPGSQPIIEFAERLKNYKTSKGTIQFPMDKKLPKTLIKKIVKFAYNNAILQ